MSRLMNHDSFIRQLWNIPFIEQYLSENTSVDDLGIFIIANLITPLHWRALQDATILNTKQCCQGAEISAAKLKKGRKIFGGAGKVRGRTFTRFIKKGPNFF
jgi:hypothetical protein